MLLLELLSFIFVFVFCRKYVAVFVFVSVSGRKRKIRFRSVSSGRQPNFACWIDGAIYIRQGGHHVGNWPTFLVLCAIAAVNMVNKDEYSHISLMNLWVDIKSPSKNQKGKHMTKTSVACQACTIDDWVYIYLTWAFFTDVQRAKCTLAYGPYVRPVCTGSAYRHFIPRHLLFAGNDNVPILLLRGCTEWPLAIHVATD